MFGEFNETRKTKTSFPKYYMPTPNNVFETVRQSLHISVYVKRSLDGLHYHTQPLKETWTILKSRSKVQEGIKVKIPEPNCTVARKNITKYFKIKIPWPRKFPCSCFFIMNCLAKITLILMEDVSHIICIRGIIIILYIFQRRSNLKKGCRLFLHF